MRFDRDIVADDGVKFGILKQDFNREFHLVDDSLSRSVVGVEQFEVFDSVIGSNPVDVVDSFFRVKLPSDVLFHDVAVLKHFVGVPSIVGRDADHHVVAAHAPSNLREPVLFPVNLAHPLIFTLATAERLSVVDRAGSFAAGFVEFLSAVFAVRFVLFVSAFAAAQRRAFTRTVHRVFAELHSVRSDVGVFHGERPATLLAGEVDGRNSGNRSSVFSFVGAMTNCPAVLSMFVFRLHFERVAAVFTGFFDRHCYSPLVGTSGVARAIT